MMPALLITRVTSPSSRGGGRDLFGLGHIEPDRLDARLLHRGGIARRRIDLAGTAGQKRLGEGKAEAAIGAGHEGN